MMTILFAMALFAFSMSITPGPVNFILLSTGVNHGFRKAVPFATGVTLGFIFQITFVALVMERVVGSYDNYLQIISYLGAAFIVYMGYKIATSNCDIGSKIKKTAAPGFKLGTLASWLNPKAWVACFAGVGAFNLVGQYTEFAVFLLIYTIVGYLSILTWAYSGTKLARFLNNCKALKIFNLTMGGCLILIAGYLIQV